MRRILSVLFGLGTLAYSAFAGNESLLIGPGDLVYVEVFDTPEMAQEVRITDGGMAHLTFLGDLKLGGDTPAQAAELIQQQLVDKKIMLHPQVKVRVEEYATQDVSVLGQVQSPGTFPTTTAQPILKIISLAGGLNSGADRNITVERHGDSAQRVKYYLANDADAALTNSVLVYPGDTVIVPKAPIVYVMGDVAHPGGYTISTNDSKLTVLQAVAMAGSANKTAVEKHTRLIRKNPQGQEQEIPVELSEIQKGKQQDIVLQPDDILYVPFSWMKNMAVSASSIAASTSSAAIYAIR